MASRRSDRGPATAATREHQFRRFVIDTADHSPAQLATCARPAEQHAELRERGVHCRDGQWIVARPPEVLAALTSPALTVADPRAAPPAGDATQLQARMARFSDGPAHDGRRERLEQVLPEATGLDTAAAQRTAATLQGRTAGFDVMALARTVPVEVLAAALGVPSAQLTHVAALVGRLCDALSPSLGPATARAG